MPQTLLVALTTFFATVGPADLLLVYPALTQHNTARERRVMALVLIGDTGVIGLRRPSCCSSRCSGKRYCGSSG